MEEKTLRRTYAPSNEKKHRINITCPYCDKSTLQKINYSMTSSIPNLIACPECKYNFIAIQKTNIKILIMEIQDGIEKIVTGSGPQTDVVEQTRL